MKKTNTTNLVLKYTFSRYAVFGIQFVNSILIAIHLGPWMLGVWGFIQLIIQYFAQINLGIPSSMNNLISMYQNNVKYVGYIFNTALGMMMLFSTGIILLFGVFYCFDLNVGKEYHFTDYAFFVCIIVLLNYLNSLFINLFRVFKQINEVIFCQSIVPVLTLAILLFIRNDQLIYYLIFANILGLFSAFLLFIFRSPVKIKPLLAKSLFDELRRRGWFLFVYNCSFYLIIISTRTLVSSSYSVEEFGMFTFSFSIASTIMLLLDSMAFVIFPTMIHQFYNLNSSTLNEKLLEYRRLYIPLAHFLTHIGILFFPMLLYFIPGYEESYKLVSIIAITQLMYANSFGFPIVLMAKRKERQIALVAFSALIFNVFLGYIFMKVFQFNLRDAILSTFTTYLMYNFFLSILARRVLGIKTAFLDDLLELYPLKLMTPIVLSIAFVLSQLSAYWYLCIIILFTALNFNELKSLMSILISLKRTAKLQ